MDGHGAAGDGRPKREQLRNAVFDRFDRHLLDRYHARHHVLSYSVEKKKLYNMVGALKLHVSFAR